MPLPASAMSRPIGVYPGAFHHPRFGTLHVERRGDGLVFRLGSAPLPATPGGEPDTITLAGPFDPPATLEFLVDEGGDTERLRLTEERVGEAVFAR